MLRRGATQILRRTRTAAAAAPRAAPAGAQPAATRHAISPTVGRWLNSTPVAPEEAKPDLMATLDEKPPEKVVKLVNEILALNMIESRELIKMLKTELNIPDGMPMGMPMMMGGGGGGGGGAAPPGAAAAAGGAAEEAAPAAAAEKTEFELKIDSFNAADKLKVIKEVRAITGLGLKESKELVEKAPSVVKGGLTKEDAEKFKAVLEANGAKATIE
jgi:large subunit ribosomal protein L7/L12